MKNLNRKWRMLELIGYMSLGEMIMAWIVRLLDHLVCVFADIDTKNMTLTLFMIGRSNAEIKNANVDFSITSRCTVLKT